jgi:type II secretory pathway component GspD/PulD (secretin)
MRKILVFMAALVLSGAMAYGQAAAGQGGEFQAPDETATSLIRVLRTTNKAQTNRYVPKVYDLKNVNPFDVVRFIRRVVEIEEGAWALYAKTDSPDDPATVQGGKVVVVAPIYQIPYIDKLMERIDTPGLTTSGGDVEFYYRPRHRHVEDTAWVSVISALGMEGDYVRDREVNGFLFYAAPSSIASVQRWLPLVDQPAPQAMIEATIYEVNVENDDSLGLDYVAWKNGPGRNLFNLGVYAEREHISSLHADAPAVAAPLYNSGIPGGTYGLPGHMFQADGAFASYVFDVSSQFFDFLVTKNKARVLTSSKVLARNGVAATLSAGEQIFYWRVADDNAPPDDRVVAPDSRTRTLGAGSTGVYVQITPLLSTEGANLTVDLDIVSHTGFDATGRPQFARRDYLSRVRVKDGEEAVLGGYSQASTMQQTSKIPILGDLPLLGYLFGGEENLVKNRQVFIVLSSRNVTDYGGTMSGEATEIDAALIRARAIKEKTAEPLKTQVGFDQWVLDPEASE